MLLFLCSLNKLLQWFHADATSWEIIIPTVLILISCFMFFLVCLHWCVFVWLTLPCEKHFKSFLKCHNYLSAVIASSEWVLSLLLWFSPRGQLSTVQPLAHQQLSGMWERTGKVKVKKIVIWEKASLIVKAKSALASKAKISFTASYQ